MYFPQRMQTHKTPRGLTTVLYCHSSCLVGQILIRGIFAIQVELAVETELQAAHLATEHQ